MDDLARVPLVNVYKDNLNTLWSTIINAIDSSCLIGIDVEFSGLGNRKSLMYSNVEDRYFAMQTNAKSRAILSLGLACFSYNAPVNDNNDGKMKSPMSYTAQIFDIPLLCMDEFVVEPSSLQFLVNHGFDFNKQVSQGLPYTKGNDKPEEMENDDMTVRKLFAHLIRSKKSVVVHNGLLDLVFLYENLYASLPLKLETFKADLSEMFEEGIFDTKFVSEYCLRLKATYLEYLFKRLQRLNCQRQKEKAPHVRVQFLDYGDNPSAVDFDDLRSISQNNVCDVARLCPGFSGYGWCENNSKCKRLHDVDLVLDLEQARRKKKGKRKRKIQKAKSNNATDTVENFKILEEDDNGEDLKIVEDQVKIVKKNVTGTDDVLDVSKNKKTCHKAGYDAFMTGYALLVYLATQDPPVDISSKCKTISDIANSIYLCGKDYPLAVKNHSAYSKTSQNHQMKANGIHK